jgi:hypothetical protein
MNQIRGQIVVTIRRGVRAAVLLLVAWAVSGRISDCGVFLASLDARRPTRDIDLDARALDNSVTEFLAVVRKIA